MAGGLGVVCSGRCGVGTGQEWYAVVFGLVVWALGRSGMQWSHSAAVPTYLTNL